MLAAAQAAGQDILVVNASSESEIEVRRHLQSSLFTPAALTFLLQTRFIIGVTGLDQPFDWATVETVMWACTAMSLLVGDLGEPGL